MKKKSKLNRNFKQNVWLGSSGPPLIPLNFINELNYFIFNHTLMDESTQREPFKRDTWQGANEGTGGVFIQ